MKRPNELTLAQASVALSAAQISSEALVQSCLDRIDERNDDVQAWCALDAEKAIADARQRDASERKSPLHGIPVGIKDIIDTKGLPTSYGNRRYQQHIPSADAQIIHQLHQLGAVVLGKTVTTEFAYYAPGPTRNPNNLEHTPGGSSSGSAAAVADFQVPFALGTQTAGSMIRPGSFNGIVALKPSFSTLPYAGVHTLAASLDTLGLFSRTIGDQRILLTTLAPHMAIQNSPSRIRVAVCRTPWWNQADTEMQEAFNDYCQSLANTGVECTDYELSTIFAELAEAQTQLMALETSRSLADEYRNHSKSLDQRTIAFIDQGLTVSVEQEADYRNLTARARLRLQAIFEQFDVILTPPAPGAAPKGLESTGDPVFNRVWTMLGVPCLTYPIRRNADNLPLGIQLIAPFGRDHQLIDIADKLQSAVRTGE